jgi:hypothetical protein
MQKGTGEHNGTARWWAVGLSPEFRESQTPSLEFARIENNRNRKSPVGRSLRGVIAMGAKVSAGGPVVAGHNMTLNAGGAELKGLLHLRNKAISDSSQAEIAKDPILDLLI